MKHLITLLLLLPLLVGAQNISVSSFKSLNGDMDARVNHPKQDQNGDKCAIIKMVTTQKGFSFDGDMNGIVDTEYKVGEYWIYVPYGSKSLTVKHEKLGVLRNYLYTVPIKEATVYELLITTAKVTTIVENFETPMQWLTISSTPDGADVYINDQYVGVTPYQKKMEVGNYNYRLQKGMYHNDAGIITLDEENKLNLNIELKPNFGYIKVSSLPESGASIEIDNRLLNDTTPYTSEPLISGKHKVTVKKVMFTPKTYEVDVTDGATIELNAELISNFGTISIATDPPADIYIDDEKKGTGSFTERLMPGIHTIEARLDKHTPEKKQIEISAGINENISLKPTQKTGSVDIMTQPFGATVYLDGKEMRETPISIKNVIIGNHNLELRKENYVSVFLPIEIKEKQSISIDKHLNKGFKVSISSNYENAKIIISDQQKNKVAFSGVLDYGTYIVNLEHNNIKIDTFIVVSKNGKRNWFFNFEENEQFQNERINSTYKTIQIGDQIWMVQNLNIKIENSYCYDYRIENCPEYGRLYTWEAAINICPDGWHLPSDEEWKTLELNLGIHQNEIDNEFGRGIAQGDRLKKAFEWSRDKINANEVGFDAIPAGYYSKGGRYSKGSITSWWTSTESSKSAAYSRSLKNRKGKIYRTTNSKTEGYSVRCIKD